MFTKTLAMVLCMALTLGVASPMIASASDDQIKSLEEKIKIETGSTDEWDGGDYVALNMSDDSTFSWFGVVYGNETHDNSITIVSAHLRFMGGAEVRNKEGGIMMVETGIPVLTVYIQKLAALVEFSDTGYLEPWDNELVGAGNGLFDFDSRGSITGDDFEFNSVEPVHKILDLNRSWNLSEIEEVSAADQIEKEWTFTLSNKNLLYDKVWDSEPAENDDGSRSGRESDGKVHDVAFTFHVGTTISDFNASLPWYRITYEDDKVAGSEEYGNRTFEGKAVTTEFKFDHWVKNWDYESDDNLLMLETVTAFGTFIPDFVQSWLDAQYPDGAEDVVGIAEIETFTGGARDVASTDGIPGESTELTKDSVVFRDNWQKIGVMDWVSNVTVDGEERDMHFQIHSGENMDWRSDEDDGNFRGMIFLGGYIYPAGNDIFHDPGYTSSVLFLDIGLGFDNPAAYLTVLVLFATSAVVVCAIASMSVRRLLQLNRMQREERWFGEDWQE